MKEDVSNLHRKIQQESRMYLLTLVSMSSFEDVPELVDIGSISTFLLYFSM
jgi:hypothetical protein